MSGLSQVRILLLAVALGAFGSVARAADPAAAEPSLDALVSLTLDEKLAYATRAVDEIKGVQTAMQKLQASAPECVETRLPLIASLIEAAERAQAQLKSLIAAGEPARADGELRKIAVALSVARKLQGEATFCSEDGVVGNAQTSYSYTGDTDSDTQAPPDFPFDTADPPEISPYQ